MSVDSPPPPSPVPTSDGPVPPPPNVALSVQGVSRWFGDVVAVSDVSFSVSSGVTALLGPNGAGKSTMLRMIAGLAPPSAGVVRVFGQDPRTNTAVRGRIGIVPQQESLFQEQRAIDFVSLAGTLNGIDDPAGQARHVLRLVELDPDDTRPIATYSKGMRQRVKLAQALVHDPALLLLDEPLSGLDPRQRLHMTRLIRSLGESGVTVLVSSHVLEEVERLGSHVMVIAQGRLAAQGDFHQIRELMDDRPHKIKVVADDARKLGGVLLAVGGINGLSLVDSSTLIVDTADAGAFRRSIAGAARDARVRLNEVQPLDDDLESVFKYLVGR